MNSKTLLEIDVTFLINLFASYFNILYLTISFKSTVNKKDILISRTVLFSYL